MNKKAAIVILALAVGALAPAATRDQLPYIPILDDCDIKLVQAEFKALHPWKPGARLPESFKDAGLTTPVVLAGMALYFDGGTRAYLFRGANGKYLVFCTGPDSYEKDGKFITTNTPELFLGAFHFMEKKKSSIPAGSATEAFLLAAVKAEQAKRLKKAAHPQ